MTAEVVQVALVDCDRCENLAMCAMRAGEWLCLDCITGKPPPACSCRKGAVDVFCSERGHRVTA